MKRTQLVCSVALLASFVFVASLRADSSSDRAAVEATGAAIRAAFAAGNVAEILKYHHPDVRKALSFQNVVVGRDALAKDLANTLSHVHVEFIENNVESLLIEDNTAIEQTLFTIKATPIGPGQPSVFHGRTMVVYVRSKDSPTGWASIRELIQPAN